MKRIICIIGVILISLLMCNSVLAAWVPVTEKNLNNAFQNIANSDDEDSYNITVSNNTITLIQDDENIVLNYDISDKPTFSSEVIIKEGMSYDDFQKELGKIISPIFGYIAVANIQGVEIDDAGWYVIFPFFEAIFNAFSGNTTNDGGYTIIDDLNNPEGFTKDKTEDPYIIYTSEFGDRVMEYVNSIYKEEQSMSDSTGINSYVMSVEKEDINDKSCKLVSTLSINTNADFSKINEYIENFKEDYSESFEEGLKDFR